MELDALSPKLMSFFISRLGVAQFCYFSISYQLYSPFPMELTYQYLVHLKTLVTNLKAVSCNMPLKKYISSHINMTDQ